ncbi:hypothetical protein SAMN04489729_2941 [Amycolatopsis lurida]|uniref:Uncharacterized protein n=1 Tax=Amycolatopsis lurida NRRL 2430 TaxID=1460371 RepID=A0A2P2FR62_AMYLU|nr:hypothetical protein BB31_21460 [Amycolatopsis lurida NRRL 2430]SEC96626.1 hypothetical protein SAMN04489729_2941 [Amycolatopsis lurida]
MDFEAEHPITDDSGRFLKQGQVRLLIYLDLGPFKIRHRLRAPSPVLAEHVTTEKFVQTVYEHTYSHPRTTRTATG